MNKLESIGHDVSIIIHNIESQTSNLIHAMERIQQDNLLPDLIAALKNMKNMSVVHILTTMQDFWLMTTGMVIFKQKSLCSGRGF